MSTSPTPAPSPPSWQHCGHGADPATNPVGCRGIHIPGYTACLAHLDTTDRDAYLAGLAPGADVDHRGTPFTEPLLISLREALHDSTTGRPCFGTASFEEAQFFGFAMFGAAQFTGEAKFDRAQFSGSAQFVGAQFSSEAKFFEVQFSGGAGFIAAEFSGLSMFGTAHFSGPAMFNGAQFTGGAKFDYAQFLGDAWFNEAQFSRPALFDHAQFSGSAWFDRAYFSDGVGFTRTQFSGGAWFDRTQFSDDAWFNEAQFATMAWFGPVQCVKRIIFSDAVFQAPVTLEIAARQVDCTRTRWESTATVRLRYATADLSHAVLSSPVAVTSHPTPFTTNGTVDESLLAGHPAGVWIASVQGVDAAHLVLTDTDLTDCLFSGAFHLDQLRLEGRCTFAPIPTGWHRRGIWPVRWTRRRTLAEEHHWRAQTAGQPALPLGGTPTPRQWHPGRLYQLDPALTPGPEDVAALYRQLRKAFEDGKNEPGAADFYYGEMEMRRHDRTGTPPGERTLLWAYWLVSGYGLRASRALGWLLASMAATVLLIMGLGLPDSSPKQVATGTVPADGGRVSLTVDKTEPELTLSVGERFTNQRFDKAVQVVLNSVVFRSSGQDLTTVGTYTEMISRFAEPVLLALAIIAMRARIKR